MGVTSGLGQYRDTGKHKKTYENIHLVSKYSIEVDIRICVHGFAWMGE